jgi:peroxiredoxin Q/BCP
MLVMFAMSVVASADDKPSVDLKAGDPAPKFECTDDTGKAWKSEEHIGKKVLVVYFYPADMTGGCTKQACGFRDDMKKLVDKGVEVVGVSGDSVENHKFFKDFHKLNFALLADESGSVAKAFGVPLTPGNTVVAKDGAGKVVTDASGNEVKLKRGVTAQRWTFVIDKNGKIAHKDTEVKKAPGDDSKKILEVAEKLAK